MITGDFVNGLHLMVGLSTDTKPETTSENTFFLEADTGGVSYFSEGEWEPAGAAVAGIVAALLNTGALPAVTATDNGKVLKVVSGAWAAATGGGGDITVDTEFNILSHNPVENAVIANAVHDAVQALNGKEDAPTVVSMSGTTPVISEAENNMIYVCGEITSLTIQSVEAGASFIVRFDSPTGTPTALTLPLADFYMPDGFSVDAYGHCEINVVNDGTVSYAVAAFWPFDE